MVTLTATPVPDATPPRVALELDTGTADNFETVTLFRDGQPLRSVAEISGTQAFAPDYDAPFDRSLSYRADYTTDAPASGSVTGSAELTLSGAADGAWLTNAARPDLALVIEYGAQGGGPYYFTENTRAETTHQTRSVRHEVEGSSAVVVASTGPRGPEEWIAEISCATEGDRQALLLLLANDVAVGLRIPERLRFLGVAEGFFSVADASTKREYGPVVDERTVVVLPMMPCEAPLYTPEQAWTWDAVNAAYASWDEVAATFSTWNDLLVGP